MPIQLREKVAIITGAGRGIGRATAIELAKHGAKGLALVDREPAVQEVAEEVRTLAEKDVVTAYTGDVADEAFRRDVFDDAEEKLGLPQILVPSAGITRDRLAVKVDKETGEPDIYPIDQFRLVTEVNLVAPIYWALEMIGRCAADRKRKGLKRWEPEEGVQGSVIFIGSVSSLGNRGQVSYAATKAGLEGAAATLTLEGMFHGVRCTVIHPGYTDTSMVRAIPGDYVEQKILPNTLLRRLIQPEEIAHAIRFLVENSAVSGEMFVDAGWQPPA